MSNTDRKAKVEGREAKGGAALRKSAARPGLRAFALCLLPFAFLLSGCRMDMQDQPRYEAYEPSKLFADGQSSRPILENTVPRGHLREDAYFYTGRVAGQQAGASGVSGGQAAGSGGAQGAGGQGANNTTLPASGTNQAGNVGGGNAGGTAQGGPDVFPFPITDEVLRRGQDRFNAFCAMCHGMTGMGDGMIVRRGFRLPPSFHDDRLQPGVSSASHFFDVITNGFGAMPSYDYMIPAEDRWKIIAYVRALQLSRRMNVNELSPEARARVASGQGQSPVLKPHTSTGQQGQGGEQH